MANYIITKSGDFVDAGELFHYGVRGQKWGVRKDEDDRYEDGSLTRIGRAHLLGYDSDDEDKDYEPRAIAPSEAEQYAYSWKRKYGSIPINRLRFEYSDDRYSSGSEYVSDFDWNRTSLSNIYDSYRDYRDSEEWD